MALTNTATSYGAVARSFHWLVAALILTQIPLGLIAEALPSATDADLARKAALFSVHKTLGVTTFLVALLRVLWAATQTHPAPLHPDRRVETWLAETVHWSLYAAILIVPLSGWLHHAATDGYAPILWPFGQSLPLVPKSAAVASFFATWHWLFTKVLIAALILHVAGALKHALVDRDATLARMTRGQSAGAPVPAQRPRAPRLAAAFLWAAAVLGASALAVPALLRDTPSGTIASGEASQWTVQEGTLAIAITQMNQPVSGRFATWSATISFDPDADGPVMGEVEVLVDISSLTLGTVTDQALSSDFLAAEDHPQAVFAAEIRRDGAAYVADGDLTLKGATVPVSLPFTLEIDGDRATAQGGLTLDRRSFSIGTGYRDEKSLAFAVEVSMNLTATRS